MNQVTLELQLTRVWPGHILYSWLGPFGSYLAWVSWDPETFCGCTRKPTLDLPKIFGVLFLFFSFSARVTRFVFHTFQQQACMVLDMSVQLRSNCDMGS